MEAPADGTAPPPPGAAAPPWWRPILGVGSLGLGGFQVLGAGFLMAMAALGPGRAAGTFALVAAAWALPGLALAVAGFGVLQDRPWAGRASVGAAVVFAACVAGLVAGRAALPPAVADAAEWAEARPEAPPLLIDYLRESRRRSGVDLRDPEAAGLTGLVYAGCCAVPVLPWYGLLLVVAGMRSAARRSRAPRGG